MTITDSNSLKIQKQMANFDLFKVLEYLSTGQEMAAQKLINAYLKTLTDELLEVYGYSTAEKEKRFVRQPMPTKFCN